MPTTPKPKTLYHADLLDKEEDSVLLIIVQAETLKEAQDKIVKKYPDREILDIGKATRLLI